MRSCTTIVHPPFRPQSYTRPLDAEPASAFDGGGIKWLARCCVESPQNTKPRGAVYSRMRVMRPVATVRPPSRMLKR